MLPVLLILTIFARELYAYDLFIGSFEEDMLRYKKNQESIMESNIINLDCPDKTVNLGGRCRPVYS